MDSDLTITHMFTDESNHTRFKKMVLPLEPKSGLGSVGLFSSLFVKILIPMRNYAYVRLSQNPDSMHIAET